MMKAPGSAPDSLSAALKMQAAIAPHTAPHSHGAYVRAERDNQLNRGIALRIITPMQVYRIGMLQRQRGSYPHGAASCRWRDPAGASHTAGPPESRASTNRDTSGGVVIVTSNR